jgi:hypothetical protein
MASRISNRRYPEKECKNLACKARFEPHDRRQEYCEPQCRINANNDKRFEANNTRFNDEKQARVNNNILASIWRKLLNQKQKFVYKNILEWEKFQFDSQAMIMQNSKTGNTILWYYDYGLELVDQTCNIFEIHKKSIK